MNPEQLHRLDLLKDRWCPFDFVRDYYGIDFGIRDPLYRDFDFWMTQRKGESFQGETIDRYWLESFLQTRRLTSRAWMALRLGMQVDSLGRIIQAMDAAGVILRYHTSGQVIGSSYEDDLWNLFPECREYVPSDHNGMCQRLHEQIEKQFGVAIRPEWCATAQALGEWQYARHLDAISLEPVCVKYEVWLDFGKWMTLAPDRCSVKTYVPNEEVLKPFAAGIARPEISPEVRAQLTPVGVE